MPQKKSKRKQQHMRAIVEYKSWEKKHPKSTHKEKFDQFDLMVDSSMLEDALHAVQTTAA
jgi:hypothetical protein